MADFDKPEKPERIAFQCEAAEKLAFEAKCDRYRLPMSLVLRLVIQQIGGGQIKIESLIRPMDE